jgi:hypothetical protein
MKHYDKRDREELDVPISFYSAHLRAMTDEELFSKADIAAELAYRDKVIFELRNELSSLKCKDNF